MTVPTETKGQKLSGGAKLAVDMGPLLVFLVAYFWGRRLVPMVGQAFGQEWCLRAGAEMFLAIGLFMPAFLVAFIFSVWKERRVAPALFMTGIIVGLLGSLTLILHNKTFFYMKPTIVYALFSSVLAVGLYSGQNYLKIVFDGAFHLPDAVWQVLTKRYAIFFAMLALANEIAWRWLVSDCPVEAAHAAPMLSGAWSWLLADCNVEQAARCAGEANWVKLKVFGFTLVSLIFTATQMPLIIKHMPDDKPTES
jgi:intracellular septation protein